MLEFEQFNAIWEQRMQVMRPPACPQGSTSPILQEYERSAEEGLEKLKEKHLAEIMAFQVTA